MSTFLQDTPLTRIVHFSLEQRIILQATSQSPKNGLFGLWVYQKLEFFDHKIILVDIGLSNIWVHMEAWILNDNNFIHPLLLHLDWLVDNCKDGWRFTSKFLSRWWWDVHPLNLLACPAVLHWQQTAITVCCRLQSSLLVHSMTAVCHYMISWLNRGTNSKKSVKPSLDALGAEIKCW